MEARFMAHFLPRQGPKILLALKDIDLCMWPDNVIYRIVLNPHIGEWILVKAGKKIS
jgi:hypothetical protein